MLVVAAVSEEVLIVILGTVYHYIFDECPLPQISHPYLFLVVCERNSSKRWQYLIQTICMGAHEGRIVYMTIILWKSIRKYYKMNNTNKQLLSHTHCHKNNRTDEFSTESILIELLVQGL